MLISLTQVNAMASWLVSWPSLFVLVEFIIRARSRLSKTYIKSCYSLAQNQAVTSHWGTITHIPSFYTGQLGLSYLPDFIAYHFSSCVWDAYHTILSVLQQVTHDHSTGKASPDPMWVDSSSMIGFSQLENHFPRMFPLTIYLKEFCCQCRSYVTLQCHFLDGIYAVCCSLDLQCPSRARVAWL